MNVKVEYSRSAANTPAFALIAEGWCELVSDGHTPDYQGICPVDAKSELFYGRSKEGDCVGVLVFTHDKQTHVITIQLAYVEPSSRQQNVFTEMFTELTGLAAQRSVKLIYADVSGENAGAKIVLTKLKAVPITVKYEFVV